MTEIFSPEINWINPLTEEHEYETSIFSTRADYDQRQSLMDVPHRRLSYSITTLDARESARLEALIRKVQGEPCYVPYWRGARYLTQPAQFSPGAKTRLYMDDVSLAGFEVDNYAMVFRGPHLVAVSKVYAILSDSILTELIAGTWPARLTKAVPAFLGQLAPESDLDYAERSMKQATLTFDLHPYRREISADCAWKFIYSGLKPELDVITWEIDPTGGPSGGPALKATIPPNTGGTALIDPVRALIKILGLPISDSLHTYTYSAEVQIKTNWNIATQSDHHGKPGLGLAPCLGMVLATGAAFNAWQTVTTSCDTFSGSPLPDRELDVYFGINQGNDNTTTPHIVWFSQLIVRDQDGNVVHTCLPAVPPVETGATPIFAPLSALHRPGTSLQKPTRKVSQLRSPAGVFSVVPAYSGPLDQHQLDLLFTDPGEWLDFRSFHDAVLGAFGPFWIPSYQQDLVPVATIPGDAVSFDIESVGYTELDFPSLNRRQIAFVKPDGSFQKRSIINAVNNGDTETITINESLGNPFTQNNANGICFLWYGRFVDDVAKTDWITADIAQVAIAMVELRDPPDGGSGDSADGYLSDTP